MGSAGNIWMGIRFLYLWLYIKVHTHTLPVYLLGQKKFLTWHLIISIGSGITAKLVDFPSQRCLICKDPAFVRWPAHQTSGRGPTENVPNFPSHTETVYSAVGIDSISLSCWGRGVWLISTWLARPADCMETMWKTQCWLLQRWSYSFQGAGGSWCKGSISISGKTRLVSFEGHLLLKVPQMCHYFF